jgi:DNA-binding transcriptional LysR family regulator
MNFDQLNVFLCVSRHLHFSRAAEELYITQPAVSASIAKLENDYGVKLFHRIGRRVELTDVGQFLVQEGSLLRDAVSQLERHLQEFNALTRGSLSIGASFTVGNYWLPQPLKRFHDQFPSIGLNCGLANAEQVLEGTSKGAFDLGFLSGNDQAELPSPLRAEAVGTERLQVVVARSHPWYGITTLKPDQLKQSPWILRESGSGARQMLARGLENVGLDLEALPHTLVLTSSEMVKAVVLQGGAAAALPEPMVRQEIDLGLLWPVSVEDLKMEQAILMVNHAGRHQSQLLLSFEEVVRQWSAINL